MDPFTEAFGKTAFWVGSAVGMVMGGVAHALDLPGWVFLGAAGCYALRASAIWWKAHL